MSIRPPRARHFEHAAGERGGDWTAEVVEQAGGVHEIILAQFRLAGQDLPNRARNRLYAEASAVAGNQVQAGFVLVERNKLPDLAGLDGAGEFLHELEQHEHISIRGRGNGRRIYYLRSLVFGQKQRAGIEEVISSPSRTPRLASVRTD